MRIKASIAIRTTLLISLIVSVTVLSTRLQADTVGSCGGASTTVPFNDVSAASVFFCSIAEAYFSGLTYGTGPNAFSPAANVPREQMAAFVTRALDQSLMRGSKHAALDQFWTNQGGNSLGLTTLPASTMPQLSQSDGADVWVADSGGNRVIRVRASDGKVLDSWTGANSAVAVLCAMGKVFATGETAGGSLYQLDPALPSGAVSTLTSSLGVSPEGIAFDGQRIWVSNLSGSVKIITLSPFSVATAAAAFVSVTGIVYDGANMWVTDSDQVLQVFKLRKLDPSDGHILASVDVGKAPRHPAFDGTNIWVPNFLAAPASSVTVVRASTATVIATLTGNGLLGPGAIAFDGERILVTNQSANSVSLWRASDLTEIGTFSTGAGTTPVGVCSDGLNFWISLNAAGKLARF
jgi:hypothetical protein